MSFRILAFALATGAASYSTATPLGSTFSYHGTLRDGGAPATGLYDLQFCLFDSPADPLPLGCAADAGDIPVDGGVFTVNLDFGAAVFNGEQRWLELRLRPGASTGGYTILSPRQVVRPAPEALRASVASAAPWSGLTGMPAGFADGSDADSGGTMSAFSLGGEFLSGSGDAVMTQGETLLLAGVPGEKIEPGTVGLAQIDTTQVQPRIGSPPCPADSFVTQISGSAAVCGAANFVASVSGGDGVTAQATGPAVQLGLDASVQRRSGAIPCPDGTAIGAIGADGTPTCRGVAALASSSSASSAAQPPTAGGTVLGGTTNVSGITGRTLLIAADVAMGSTTGAGDLALSICAQGITVGGTQAFVSQAGPTGLTAAAGQRTLFSFTRVLSPGSTASLAGLAVSICGQSGSGAAWNNNGNATVTVIVL